MTSFSISISPTVGIMWNVHLKMNVSMVIIVVLLNRKYVLIFLKVSNVDVVLVISLDWMVVSQFVHWVSGKILIVIFFEFSCSSIFGYTYKFILILMKLLMNPHYFKRHHFANGKKLTKIMKNWRMYISIHSYVRK